ncbi:MAG: hypothetical protein VX737_02930 [Pseudomonadota bacterium]|nr:hypothetical protein [Pseudomonadota bacterium]
MIHIYRNKERKTHPTIYQKIFECLKDDELDESWKDNLEGILKSPPGLYSGSYYSDRKFFKQCVLENETAKRRLSELGIEVDSVPTNVITLAQINNAFKLPSSHVSSSPTEPASLTSTVESASPTSTAASPPPTSASEPASPTFMAEPASPTSTDGHASRIFPEEPLEVVPAPSSSRSLPRALKAIGVGALVIGGMALLYYRGDQLPAVWGAIQENALSSGASVAETLTGLGSQLGSLSGSVVNNLAGLKDAAGSTLSSISTVPTALSTSVSDNFGNIQQMLSHIQENIPIIGGASQVLQNLSVEEASKLTGYLYGKLGSFDFSSLGSKEEVSNMVALYTRNIDGGELTTISPKLANLPIDQIASWFLLSMLALKLYSSKTSNDEIKKSTKSRTWRERLTSSLPWILGGTLLLGTSSQSQWFELLAEKSHSLFSPDSMDLVVAGTAVSTATAATATTAASTFALGQAVTAGLGLALMGKGLKNLVNSEGPEHSSPSKKDPKKDAKAVDSAKFSPGKATLIPVDREGLDLDTGEFVIGYSVKAEDTIFHKYHRSPADSSNFILKEDAPKSLEGKKVESISVSWSNDDQNGKNSVSYHAGLKAMSEALEKFPNKRLNLECSDADFLDGVKAALLAKGKEFNTTVKNAKELSKKFSLDSSSPRKAKLDKLHDSVTTLPSAPPISKEKSNKGKNHRPPMGSPTTGK